VLDCELVIGGQYKNGSTNNMHANKNKSIKWESGISDDPGLGPRIWGCYRNGIRALGYNLRNGRESLRTQTSLRKKDGLLKT
jgi:hypothetical protein